LTTAGAGLASNGANLPAVLAARQRNAPAEFARLEAELVRLLPEFTGIVLEQDAGGRVRLSLGIDGVEESVRAENLSQGVFYLLGLLVLSFDPAPPAVVCIEEIDRGIHPRMLREVRDVLYRLSYPASFGEKRSPVQVIATTHSPYMLDQFRDHPEEVVITQKLGHEARFERLSDRVDLPELLREGTLGDMWFSGVLGGVPEER
jgi:predicted ATPase